MFSQQNKRINVQNLHNPFPQFQTPYNGGVIQGLQPNSCVYSDFQMPGNLSDNFSLYSSNSTATNITNFKKRNFTEEVNSVLSICLEEFLPRVAEECAEAVYAKITFELERQAKEIAELKIQLENIKNNLANHCLTNFGSKNSTPMKKVKNVNDNLRKINANLSYQSGVMKDCNENTMGNSYLEAVQEKLKFLQEKIEDERRSAELLNTNMKDRYVDFLGIKNFVDERVGYLLNDMQLNSQGNSKSEEEIKFSQVINSIDALFEEIVNKPVKRNFLSSEVQMEKIHEVNIQGGKNFQSMQPFQVMQGVNSFSSLQVNNFNNFNNKPPSFPQIFQNSNTSPKKSLKSTPSTLQSNLQTPIHNNLPKSIIKNKKTPKIASFNKFSF